MKSYFVRFAKFTAIGTFSAIVVFLLFNSTRPKSYDDCILKNMRGGQGDQAAMIIAASCRKQFPVQYISEDEFMGRK
jgi:hypothetical protein